VGGATLTVLPHFHGNVPAVYDINNRDQIVGVVGTAPEGQEPHAVLFNPTR
jgi:hypothetical protein